MSDTQLPREVPVDPNLDVLLQDNFVSVEFAAKVAGVHPNTILRHLKNGTLAGLRAGGKSWLVLRATTGDVPAIDTWKPGRPGNPQWKSD